MNPLLPEQSARRIIDHKLEESGWIIQNKDELNLTAGVGIAVREYNTSVGPADYVLFVNKSLVGVIEAKRDEEGVNLTVHEAQADYYNQAKFKHFNNEPLRFAYLATSVITKFKDNNDPKPNYREVFTFHRPETLALWVSVGDSVRRRYANQFPPLITKGLRDCQIEAIKNLEISLANAKPRRCFM